MKKIKVLGNSAKVFKILEKEEIILDSKLPREAWH